MGADPRVYAECSSLKPSGLMHLYEQIRDVNAAVQGESRAVLLSLASVPNHSSRSWDSMISLDLLLLFGIPSFIQHSYSIGDF